MDVVFVRLGLFAAIWHWAGSRRGRARLHVAPRERNRSLIWRHSLVVLRAAPVAGGRPTLRHNRIAGGGGGCGREGHERAQI